MAADSSHEAPGPGAWLLDTSHLTTSCSTYHQPLFRDDFLKAFESVDAILTPTTPSPAFKLGEKTADPVQMYLSDIYTIAVNLAGLPALSLPMGFDAGLPLGAQIIGKHFAESTLLKLGHHFQTHTNYHQCIPDAFAD